MAELRVAEDGKPYTLNEFKDYYGKVVGLKQWNASAPRTPWFNQIPDDEPTLSAEAEGDYEKARKIHAEFTAAMSRFNLRPTTSKKATPTAEDDDDLTKFHDNTVALFAFHCSLTGAQFTPKYKAKFGPLPEGKLWVLLAKNPKLDVVETPMPNAPGNQKQLGISLKKIADPVAIPGSSSSPNTSETRDPHGAKEKRAKRAAAKLSVKETAAMAASEEETISVSP